MRKARATREIPPPLELECLRALWTLGEANVQAVRGHLEPGRPLAYTTVMTMLDRLARKQAVTRRKVGRSFLYTPILSREQVRSLAVKELVDTLFDGSPASLAAYLDGKPAAETASNGAFAGAIDETLL
ncbi:MAG: BlaI/MecI/CopY family transcriptional regulator [Bryobacteraceae bacterium]|nr:BlaI/MecI/CopY family transcriptional regulator [Solibacteraceae bacterium]MCL4842959.1 BlaI/MecI/CopY family transcriptional regulator [Bryobacteraceae bacterium]MCO5351574.1 BlaI/MecI/CopY family transcriptional regulator [Bryobacteraceae bacterium]